MPNYTPTETRGQMMTQTIDTDTTYATGHAMQAIRHVTEAYWSRTRQNRRFTEAGYGLSTEYDDALRWLCPDGWAVDIPASELPDVLTDWIQVLYETDQGLPEYDDDPRRYAVGSAWVRDTVKQAIADLEHTLTYWRAGR